MNQGTGRRQQKHGGTVSQGTVSTSWVNWALEGRSDAIPHHHDGRTRPGAAGCTQRRDPGVGSAADREKLERWQGGSELNNRANRNGKTQRPFRNRKSGLSGGEEGGRVGKRVKQESQSPTWVVRIVLSMGKAIYMLSAGGCGGPCTKLAEM